MVSQIDAAQRKLIRVVIVALMHDLDVHATVAEHITRNRRATKSTAHYES
ncbi:hypothetical protein ACQPXH_17490 [Nocardia sp. CA-135953]